ncbi:MAG: hypothetical protein ABSA48_06730 [Terracidiphilus sp.]|jgi:hypothetical protein
MQARWIFTPFYTDELIGMMAPVAAAYGVGWHCANFPATEGGSALCQILCNTHQIAAAKQNPRIIVCSLLIDPAPVDQIIIAAYGGQGATAGMSMGALIATLAETESNYTYELVR